jgi:hypothetical protein
MTRDHVLFSDRAIREVNDVFQKAMDLQETLPDLISTTINISLNISGTGKVCF